jgi:NitT/TauT family transport system substrate-binding protein
MHAIRSRFFRQFVALAGLAMAVLPAAAQDKVSVGVMTVSSSLPYFVALDQGFFTEQHIETEMTKLMGGPPNIAAMITNQIDVAAVLVTIEGMNANLKKPGVAMFIALDGQNSVYQMDQIVARNGFKADSLKDLKGAKLLSAPGPANLAMARAALAAVGLKDGDYSIDQLDMALHVGALKAGTYDGGYTLEPNASIMRKLGIARTLEAGVVAHYVLGDPKAFAFSAGCAITSHFIETRPEVAKRFVAAWAKAVHFINDHPAEARQALAKNGLVPADIASSVPVHRYFMASDLEARNVAEFQKYIDFFAKNGTLPERIDVTKYIKAF